MVYIILLNYNGWKDTIECLESVFKLEYKDYRVIVCDNNSSDNSMEQIKKWAEGKIKAHIASVGDYTDLSEVAKPIIYSYYTKPMDFFYEDAKLVLIENCANNGYAAGCNIGIKYALAQQNVDLVWLLNNDTVVCRDALSKIMIYMKNYPDAALAGTCLKYYYYPKMIQGFGSTYNPFWGTTRFINNVEDIRLIHHPLGASMILSNQLLLKLGFMCEDYFLYYEEVDLAIKARRENFKIGCIPDAIVYHKEGASIGSGKRQKNSILGDRYMVRNRIMITKRFYPHFLLTVYIGLIITIARRLYKGQFKNALCVLKIIFGVEKY